MSSFFRKIYLIRHGETAWTLSGKHTGLTDIPLTENGRKQAKAISVRLRDVQFQRVYTSPLKRAAETCELAGFFKKAVIDEDLVEWNYGDYEGLTTSEIRKKDAGWNIFTRGVPNGESVADIGARANKVLIKLKETNGDVAIFSHGHFLRVLAARWLDLRPADGKFFALSAGSISILGFEHASPVIEGWNDVTHLKL